MRTRYSGRDQYTYTDSAVLVNKFDIRDGLELDEVELTFTSLRLIELTREFSKEAPTFSLFCRIHEHIFQDVYEWAGEPRTVEVSKGSTRFATWPQIVPEGHRILSDLGKLELNQMPPGQFSETLGYYWGELNVLHPFREGNGRTTRALLELLTEWRGFRMDWTQTESQEVVEACIKAVDVDHSGLSEILAKVIS